MHKKTDTILTKNLLFAVIFLLGMGIVGQANAQTSIPTNSCPSLPTNTGSVTIPTDITASGTYNIWSRIMIPDTINNSYWLQIDNKCGMLIGDKQDMPTNVWTWLNIPTTIQLTQGAHLITLIGNKPGVKIDKLVFTQDLTCIPLNLGQNCTTAPITPTSVATATIQPTNTIAPSAITPTPFLPTIKPSNLPTPTKITIPSATPTPLIATGSFSIKPIADTFVRNDKTSTSYGKAKTLEVDQDNNKIIYMKFDLKVFKNMRINTAKLRLYVVNGSDSKQSLKEVKNTNWQESTLTYKNRPATSATITSITGGKINTWKEIDLTKFVKENAGNIVSLAFESSGNNGLDFASRDSFKNQPELVITY
ncbi:MAG: DNRLRE domain-containing protein [Patescibacteria group bacterium]